MNFKESPLMYIMACAIVAFVLAQSIFFLVKAWKQGRKLGITTETLRNAVTSSALFSIAPAISIVATVLTLAASLGIVLPWIRLSVIGNITYETTAAEAALNALGKSISQPVETPQEFSAIMWVMTVGSILPLVLITIFLKKIQGKIGNAAANNAKLADVLSAAAFIGLIAAFIARSIAGSGKPDVIGDGAGVLSVLTLVISIVLMVVLTKIATHFQLGWLENFTMPLSMIGAMAAAMLLARILPESIALLEWRG